VIKSAKPRDKAKEYGIVLKVIQIYL